MLRLPAHRRVELFRTYSFVIALPDEIVAQIRKVDRERYNCALPMRWHDKVSHAFEVDFSGGVPVPHFTERYDGETLAHLEWCDDVLRRGLPGRSIPQ